MKALLTPPRPLEGLAAEFSWKPGVYIPVPADVAARELMRLDAARGGKVRPEDVIAEARPEGAPLHPAFEWDDGAAAEMYRKEQARHLTRHIVVTYPKEDGTRTEPARLFIKLTSAGDEPTSEFEAEARQPHVYTLTTRVMADESARQHYIRTAFKEGKAWMQRYRDIKEFERVFRELQALEPTLGQRP